MKIRLSKDEDGGWFECDSKYAELVEVPDAIVKDFRVTVARLRELEAYFDEQIQPQLDAIAVEKRRAWRRANPEAAAWQDAMHSRWQKMLLAQYESLVNLVGRKP